MSSRDGSSRGPTASLSWPAPGVQLDRLEALCDGLLDLSRLEADADGEERSEFDLVPVLSELGEQFASRAEQAGIEFVLSQTNGTVPVLGSENQMR